MYPLPAILHPLPNLPDQVRQPRSVGIVGADRARSLAPPGLGSIPAGTRNPPVPTHLRSAIDTSRPSSGLATHNIPTRRPSSRTRPDADSVCGRPGSCHEPLNADRRSRAAGDRLRGAARATSRGLGETSDRLAGAAAAAQHAGGDLDGAVRTHHRGLQDARRLVGAGLTRIQQHIEHTRDSGPSR